MNLIGGDTTINSGSGTLAIAQNAGSIGTLNIGTGGTAGTIEAAAITGGSGTATVNINQSGTYTFGLQLAGTLTFVNGTGDTVLAAGNT